jgi:hypothetical protein
VFFHFGPSAKLNVMVPPFPGATLLASLTMLGMGQHPVDDSGT